MLLQNDRDRFGFCATEGEMIIANANLNWITERRALYYPNTGTGHNAHFHQTKPLAFGRLNRGHPRRYIPWNHV